MKNKNEELKLVFPTPIWASLVQDSENLNKIIYDYILKIKEKYPEGKKVSNILGWHSPDFNLEDKEIKNFINSDIFVISSLNYEGVEKLMDNLFTYKNIVDD